MLLRQILTGRQQSSFILITDNVELKGHSILSQLLEQPLSKNNNVHLFAYENRDYEFVSDLNKQYYPSEIHVYDCFTDPLNWFGKGPEVSLENISEVLTKRDIAVRTKDILVIDSLVYPLKQYGLHDLCQILRKLTPQNHKSKKEGAVLSQVIALLNGPMLDEESTEYKQLDQFATSLIKVEQRLSSENKFQLYVRQKKSSGKIQQQRYECWLDKGGKFVHEEMKSVEEMGRVEEEPKLELTTFKLSLNQEEIESKKKVVLPYLKARTEGSGKIFYEPDPNDDWDDEDPDDDLEI